MSLRKEIERAQRHKRVASDEKFLEVASKGGGIAGDIRDVPRLQVENSPDDEVLGAGSWWIEQQKIDGLK